MVFRSDTYSVLLVSASEKMNTAMASVLPPTDFWPVQTAHSLSQARRLTLEKPFDLILVNSPLPDGVGVPFCIDVCANSLQQLALDVPGDDNICIVLASLLSDDDERATPPSLLSRILKRMFG